MELYESNIASPCAVFVKDEIVALNPPVSPRVSKRAGGGECVLFRTHAAANMPMCWSTSALT